MKKLFIPYELAVIAKEKGFDELCFGYYNSKQELRYQGQEEPLGGMDVKDMSNDLLNSKYCSAPLYQQIIDWFREEHEIEIYCLKQIEENEYGGIVGWSGIEEYSTKSCDADYYKALNKTFEEAFKLI